MIASTASMNWPDAVALSVMSVCATVCTYAWFRWGKRAYDDSDKE